MPDIPEAALAAGAEAVNEAHAKRGWNKPAPWWVKEVSAAVLDAAAPLLAEEVAAKTCRKMARDILALDQEDRNLERKGARNVGPYGDMKTSLRRLARGEPLPDVRELRGGEGAEHG